MTAKSFGTLDGLFESLPRNLSEHIPGTPAYARLKTAARSAIEHSFSGADGSTHGFGPFGQLAFPYQRMGAIDSLDLFGLDELILFSFYWTNRGRYRRVVDIGANIGLHSIVMSRCGFAVRSYEPDPRHFEVLERNLRDNGCRTVSAVRKAVSNRKGTAEFVRVLGNTTGSHLAGAKKNPYGPIDRFEVELEDIGVLNGSADLFKIDAEGHEYEILKGTSDHFWQKTDAVVEVGTTENAMKLFEHLRSVGVHLFSQKTGWQVVKALSAMPTSYKEGSLFISAKKEMPWT